MSVKSNYCLLLIDSYKHGHMLLFIFKMKKEAGGGHLPCQPGQSISHMNLVSPRVTH